MESSSRRDFLKAGGARIVGAALLGVAGCGGEQAESEALATIQKGDADVVD